MADEPGRGTDRPLEIGIERAHPARMYDYYLGGRTNFDPDREAAEAALAAFPTLRTTAEENRGFLLRAVEHLARSGIRQFVDVGSGIPVAGRNTHDAAQAVRAQARVLYVDNDPIVLAHAQALLTSGPRGRTAYLNADPRRPETILEHPEFVRSVDFDEPVAMLLVAILHFVADHQDPLDLLRRLTRRLPSGSRLVIAHVTGDYDPKGWAGLVRAYADAGITVRPRSRAEVAELLDGWDVEAPGVVPVSRWHPTAEPSAEPALVSCYGAVARKP
ncbi:SAM-dependent methyltransferase [Embleya sp. NPDC059237]|uniref:SAM-dependent methyltransferase n=1 Tax=Embleya sp. NPDC059237 TaxID=3346784 RepID=UPI0036C0D684